MKKISAILFILTLLVTACKNDVHKDYITLKGVIAHQGDNNLYIKNMQDQVIKTIALKDDGSFQDTLRLDKGIYLMDYDKKYFKLFLYPDSDLKIEADNEDFENTLHFSGKGSGENNFTLKRIHKINDLFENVNDLYIKEEKDFNQSLEQTEKSFNAMLADEGKKLDSVYLNDAMKDSKGMFTYIKRYYKMKHDMLAMVGKPSPEFNDYENAAGGKSSLKDFRGKYVYIDNWATWCRPCLGELPYLKKLEEKYGDKIHFVSISLDKVSDHDTWKKMVKEKGLKGVQLFAGADQQFATDYKIMSIPRFIIIDPEGKVYDPDAPRPSSKKIESVLDKLL